MMFGLKIFPLKLSSLLFFFFLLISQLSFSQSEVANRLKEAYNTKSIDSLLKFVETYPNETIYVQEAKRIIDQFAFEIVTQKNTIEAYEEYVEKYPNAVQTIKAKQWIELNSTKLRQKEEEKAYRRAKEINTIKSYNEFITEFPNSKYINYAQDKINEFQYNENISKFSIEELTRFLIQYPNNPKNKFLFDTLQTQTLRYLSYEGLIFISKNRLFNIDFENFLIQFATQYTQSGETKNFEKLFKDFTQLKSNKKLNIQYQDAKTIESLLKMSTIDDRTYNTHKEYFTTIKNDKSLYLIKKYLLPLIAQKKITNINKVLQTVEDDFRVKQFQQMLFQPPFPIHSQERISYNKDSTIKLVVDSKTSGYGESDIYVSLKKDDVWQDPFILPKPINSRYKELSPKINKEGNVLFFYSDNGMTNSTLDLFVSFRQDNDSWENWSMPLKVSEIDLINANKHYNKGYVKDQDNNPMDALVYIDDAKTGERLFVSQSNPQTGFFAYPKQKNNVNIISISKGYLSKYYSQAEDLNIKQNSIDDMYSKRIILTIESIFSEDMPDKLSNSAENYIKYLAKSLQGLKYIITISVHSQKGYKTLDQQGISWQQATLIKDKLISFGINYENVVSAGYGNKNPLIGWEGKNRIEIGFIIIGGVSN